MQQDPLMNNSAFQIYFIHYQTYILMWIENINIHK